MPPTRGGRAGGAAWVHDAPAQVIAPIHPLTTESRSAALGQECASRRGAAWLHAEVPGWNTSAHNVILTLARIWSTVATGVIRSKGAAAD